MLWFFVSPEHTPSFHRQRAGGLEALMCDRHTGDLSLFAVKECLEVVAHRGVDFTKYSDARMYSNTSFIARQIAGLMLKMLFRFNKSVQRSSAHALGDTQEIKMAYYDLLNTGRELGVNMPIMSSFESDIIRLLMLIETRMRCPATDSSRRSMLASIETVRRLFTMILKRMAKISK